VIRTRDRGRHRRGDPAGDPGAGALAAGGRGTGGVPPGE